MNNGGVAAVLSFFIPGLGQIYNGQIVKGLILMLIFAASFPLMYVLVGFILYPIVWLFAMYDGYTVGKRQG